jgi:hypothetical protein
VLSAKLAARALTISGLRARLPAVDDGYMDGYIQDELELDLLALGGQQLLGSAHDEADDYVDREYPWDGVGDEPAERASAWLAVLWQRAEEARGEIAARNQRSNP